MQTLKLDTVVLAQQNYSLYQRNETARNYSHSVSAKRNFSEICLTLGLALELITMITLAIFCVTL